MTIEKMTIVAILAALMIIMALVWTALPVTSSAQPSLPAETNHALSIDGKTYYVSAEAGERKITNIGVCTATHDGCPDYSGYALYLLLEPTLNTEPTMLNVTLPMKLINKLFGWGAYSGAESYYFYSLPYEFMTYTLSTSPFTSYQDDQNRRMSNLAHTPAVDYGCESVSYSVMIPPVINRVDLSQYEVGHLPEAQPRPGDSNFVAVYLNITADGKQYGFPISANTDSCTATLLQEEKRLHLDISVAEGEERGMMRIDIPEFILGGNYTVLADGQPINANWYKNSDGTYHPPSGQPLNARMGVIKIDFSNQTKSIDVIGTEVIPEFGHAPQALILISIFTGLTLLTRIAYEKLRFLHPRDS